MICGQRGHSARSLLGKGAGLGVSALTLLTLAGCSVHRVVTVVPPTAPPIAAQAKFLVFDAMLYTGKPDLSQYGLTPISVEYPDVLWPGTSANMQNVPDETVVQKLAAGASQSASMAVVDIEQWAVTGDSATVAQSVAKYQQTLQMFQQDAPSVQFGFYATAPIRDYWDVMRRTAISGVFGLATAERCSGPDRSAGQCAVPLPLHVLCRPGWLAKICDC